VQICHRLVFWGPGFRPPRFRFFIDSFWGQAFGRHDSTLSSTRLFGARLSAATVQLCHRLVFLGPGFRPPRFNFVVDSSFWGQAFSRHTLSSIRLFGASAGKHKFPYHQEEIRFLGKIGFLGTTNPFTPPIRCTNRWYEDFRSPALIQRILLLNELLLNSITNTSAPKFFKFVTDASLLSL
jgi:hypothetical protein